MTTRSRPRILDRRPNARRLILRASAGCLALLATAARYDALRPGDPSLHVVVWAGAVGIAIGLPPAVLLRRRRQRLARAAVL